MDFSFLAVYPNQIFHNPASRQNFANALADMCITVLRVRPSPILYGLQLQGRLHFRDYLISIGPRYT